MLDPEIKKGKFTEEEDNTLIQLYMHYGPKWATIAKHFINRTADMIKNRFHSSIKKMFYTSNNTVRKSSFVSKVKLIIIINFLSLFLIKINRSQKLIKKTLIHITKLRHIKIVSLLCLLLKTHT